MAMERMRTTVLQHQCDGGALAALLDLVVIYTTVAIVAIRVLLLPV